MAPPIVSSIWRNFVDAPRGEFKNKRLACRFCKYTQGSKSVERAQKHIDYCPGLKERARKQSDSIMVHTLFERHHQSTLDVPKLTLSELSRLQEHLALMIFDLSLPLSIVNKPSFKAFITAINPAFKLPSRQALSNHLLDTIYSNVKAEVLQIIQKAHYINVAIDESDSNSAHRIANISINIQGINYYWQTEDLGNTRATADNITTLLARNL